MNGLSIALQSGSILLREGVEAMLIIAALAAFLHRMDAAGRVRALYAGAVAAIGASLLTAVVFAYFYNGAHDDRLEAAVLIVAAALMLYMSGWLFLRQNPARWTAELKKVAQQALVAPKASAIAGIAFLAVFREGAETVLFVQALANTSGGWTVGLLAGLAGAAVLLTGFFVAMQWLTIRLPLRPVFLFTSALLFVMGLRFAGAALQELQEQALLSVTPAPYSDWIAAAGFNPTLEALFAQAFIAVAAIAGTALAARPWRGGQGKAEHGNAQSPAAAE